MSLILRMKSIIKLLLSLGRPMNMRELGARSYIAWPRKLEGKKHISIGADVTIGSFSWLAAYETYQHFHYRPMLGIGDHVIIGRHSCITAIDKVAIGKGCLLSEYVYISDHFHQNDPGEVPLVEQPLVSKGPVVIENNCFLGYRSAVLSGVKLGAHCIVGAHSVVTHSFPEYSMVAGAPARLIKKYCMKTRQWESLENLEKIST